MQVIGAVGGTRFSIQPLVQLPVDELRSIWANWADGEAEMTIQCQSNKLRDLEKVNRL